MQTAVYELLLRIGRFLRWIEYASAEQRADPEVAEAVQAFADEVQSIIEEYDENHTDY